MFSAGRGLQTFFCRRHCALQCFCFHLPRNAKMLAAGWKSERRTSRTTIGACGSLPSRSIFIVWRSTLGPKMRSFVVLMLYVLYLDFSERSGVLENFKFYLFAYAVSLDRWKPMWSYDLAYILLLFQIVRFYYFGMSFIFLFSRVATWYSCYAGIPYSRLENDTSDMYGN